MPTLKVQNLYNTTVTEAGGIPATGDCNFTVASPPTYSNGFIIISPDNSSLREIMYYHDVIGSRIYVRGENRFSPKAHGVTEVVKMNDVAEIFNTFSDMISQAFYVEKTGGLNVRIWGGYVYYNGSPISVPDTNLILANNTTNYIKYDYPTNTFSVDTVNSGNIKAQVITSSGAISSITYRTAKESYIDFTVALTGALPSQTGNAGKALVTDGSNVSWQSVLKQTGNGIDKIIGTNSSGVITEYSKGTVNDVLLGDLSFIPRSSLIPQGLVESVFYAGQSITQGDSLFLESMETFSLATNAENISDITANTRHEIPMFGTGVAFTQIQFALRNVGTPTQNLNFRIETDNAGVPSGTLFSANGIGTIAPGSLTGSFANKTITFGGSMTIPIGTKVWIVMFQGTYGTETINNVNYYQIGTGTKHSSTRPSFKYNGSAHTTEKPISTSTWTGDTFIGALNGHSVGATANANIKVYTITKTGNTAWTTCIVSQGNLSQSASFVGNIATFATPVLIVAGAFNIAFSGGNLNTYQATTQSVTDPLITVGATPSSLRGIDCKAQGPKAFISSVGLLDTMLAKTSANVIYKIGSYPRIATNTVSAGALCQSTITGLADAPSIIEGGEYFIGDIEGSISTTQGSNKITIGKGVGSKLLLGRFQTGLKNIISAGVSVTSSGVMHHGGDVLFAYNFGNLGTPPTITVQNSTDLGVTWNTYYTISGEYVQGTTAGGVGSITIQIPQSLIRVQTNSTATVNVYH